MPEGTWRWKNFSPAEIACRGTGKLLINEPALDKLQALRDRLGKPLIVRSAYRSRTMKGGGAAGVAILGAAGVEVAQNILAETQSVPYVALGGIAVTM